MTDVSNTQVLERNLGFKELFAQPNVWRLLIVLGAPTALIAGFMVATYLDVQNLNVDVATVKANQINMQNDLTEMKSDINDLNEKVEKLDGKVEKLDGKMGIKIDLLNGNNINRSVPKD